MLPDPIEPREPIELWNWPGLPTPPREFRLLVQREVADATRRAMTILRERSPAKPRPRRGGGRPRTEVCVACGIRSDERTPGCRNCRIRLYNRAIRDRAKAAA